jgi:hypothetical protein
MKQNVLLKDQNELKIVLAELLVFCTLVTLPVGQVRSGTGKSKCPSRHGKKHQPKVTGVVNQKTEEDGGKSKHWAFKRKQGGNWTHVVDGQAGNDDGASNYDTLTIEVNEHVSARHGNAEDLSTEEVDDTITNIENGPAVDANVAVEVQPNEQKKKLGVEGSCTFSKDCQKTVDNCKTDQVSKI